MGVNANFKVVKFKEYSLKISLILFSTYFLAFLLGVYSSKIHVLKFFGESIKPYTPHLIVEALEDRVKTASLQGSTVDVVFSMLFLAASYKSLLYSIHALIPLLPSLTMFVRGVFLDVIYRNSIVFLESIWLNFVEALSLSFILGGVISTFKEGGSRHYLAYSLLLQFVSSIIGLSLKILV